MGNKIGIDRYVFTECLAYEIPKKKKASYIFLEILRVIPLISTLLEAKKLKETLKKRNLYVENRDKYIFDARFSYFAILKYTVNAIGLGLLILPLRLTAAYMKRQDQVHHRICENPHRLDHFKMHTCITLTAKADRHFQGILSQCPGEDDFCRRMAFRDHVQHPEYVCKSLYEDPFEKPGDATVKEKLRESQKKNLIEQRARIKQIVKRRTNGDSFSSK